MKGLVFIKKQKPEEFCKTGVLKNFAKFTGKHLWWSLFLIQTVIELTYESRRLGAFYKKTVVKIFSEFTGKQLQCSPAPIPDVFMLILQKISEHVSSRTPVKICLKGKCPGADILLFASSACEN